MKKILKSIFGFLLFVSCFPATAQRYDDMPLLEHVLKFYPTQLGEINLAYEHVLSTKQSNEFALGYIYKSYAKGDGWFGNMEDCIGAGFRMSQRNYTTKKKEAPHGFFYGPSGSYKFVLFHEDALPRRRFDAAGNIVAGVGRVTQHSLAFQYLVGYHVIGWEWLSVEVYGGLGARLIVGRASGGEEDLHNFIIGHTLKKDRHTVINAVPAPTLNAAIGWAF